MFIQLMRKCTRLCVLSNLPRRPWRPIWSIAGSQIHAAPVHSLSGQLLQTAERRNARLSPITQVAATTTNFDNPFDGSVEVGGPEYIRRLLAGTADERMPAYYWPLMYTRWRRYGTEGVFRTLREMQQLNVPIDEITLKNFVILCLMPPKDAKGRHINNQLQAPPESTLRRLAERGIPISAIYSYLVLQQILIANFRQVRYLCQHFETPVDTVLLPPALANNGTICQNVKVPERLARTIAALTKRAQDRRVDLTGAVLYELVWQCDGTTFESFLNEFMQQNLKISQAALDAILVQLQRISGGADVDRQSRVAHLLNSMRSPELTVLPNSGSARKWALRIPRFPTPEELHNLLDAYRHDGAARAGMLLYLLESQTQHDHIQDVAKLLQTLSELEHRNDYRTLRAKLAVYAFQDNLERAEQVLKEIRQKYPNVSLDEHIAVRFAKLLVSNNRYDEAMQLLETRAKQSKVLVDKEINFLLLAISHYNATGDNNLTFKAFKLLHGWGYVTPHKNSCAPIIEDCLRREDFSGAVDAVCEIARLYKCTPTNTDKLLMILIQRKKDNEPELQQLINRVVQANARIYGVRYANFKLLFATAHGSNTEELNRLLSSPDFSFSCGSLLRKCGEKAKRGEIKGAVRLANVLGAAIKEDIHITISEKILECNHLGAISELYKILEPNNDFVSQRILVQLANCLKANGIAVPSGARTSNEHANQ